MPRQTGDDRQAPTRKAYRLKLTKWGKERDVIVGIITRETIVIQKEGSHYQYFNTTWL